MLPSYGVTTDVSVVRLSSSVIPPTFCLWQKVRNADQDISVKRVDSDWNAFVEAVNKRSLHRGCSRQIYFRGMYFIGVEVDIMLAMARDPKG